MASIINIGDKGERRSDARIIRPETKTICTKRQADEWARAQAPRDPENLQEFGRSMQAFLDASKSVWNDPKRDIQPAAPVRWLALVQSSNTRLTRPIGGS